MLPLFCSSACLFCTVRLRFSPIVLDSESSTKPTSTKLGSMEACKYGLTRVVYLDWGLGRRAAVGLVVFFVRRGVVCFFSFLNYMLLRTDAACY